MTRLRQGYGAAGQGRGNNKQGKADHHLFGNYDTAWQAGQQGAGFPEIPDPSNPVF
jgi:hypothetical protein